MHRFAARQSIVDKNNNIFAYEMLFRDSLINVFPKIDANSATEQIIETTLASRQSKTLTKHKPAFINFTLETLSKGYPLQFKQEHIIVELLETEEPSEELLEHCKNLHSLGYQIALDDFIHHQDWHNFFPYINIIKVDFQQTGHDEILELIEHLTDFPNIQLLAEKLENQQEHTLAKNLGFELFQGFLFDKPEVIKSNVPRTDFEFYEARLELV
ncbi:EAL and HDOD domain-containing protein [Thalassomonas sp. M1454]|uniref:EAL and HDOD domain-containing protein n=1 Tax=Thalassomonas sp. M1454 TaxID=2594477 RepID=UPI00117CD506|nr:EAL domain-containing protein [Thalassomonas sp. M1454]TRX57392.1 EAL domain-containing protein [Thalassomonas sp. M1454]